MADFFRAAVDFFSTCYKYIQLLVENILLIPQLFELALSSIGDWIMILPESLVLVASVICLVCVVFMILGR